MTVRDFVNTAARGYVYDRFETVPAPSAAELEEARALAEADPKVRAGYLTVEAIPWIAVPGDTNSTGLS